LDRLSSASFAPASLRRRRRRRWARGFRPQCTPT
jgi:hypothetical protein